MTKSESQEPQTYHSADFDKTPPRPRVVLPEKIIHRQVESAGEQDEYSKERKHPVFFVDLPSRCISMTIGWLDPGQSSNRHRHTYETVLYVLEGEGYSDIHGQRVEWKAGDAVYIPVWAWHNHVNTSQTGRARYLACENAPLLQNIGGIALREEVDKMKGEPKE
jgi:mannose-6-phosphate isomerase-like protein (cupin superfamily)